MANERRRSSRLEILDRIHGHIVSLDVPVKVRELSLGGMRVETEFEFPVEAVHEFRLTLGDESTTVLRGRILRCEEHTDVSGRRLYISAVQFLDDDPTSGDAAIGNLIDRIK